MRSSSSRALAVGAAAAVAAAGEGPALPPRDDLFGTRREGPKAPEADAAPRIDAEDAPEA
jgi:hypothetical protein